MTGWPSIAEIEDIAGWAARRHWSHLLTFDARWEAARDGVIEAIVEGDDDLWMAALTAISRAVDARKQMHGIPAGRTGTGRNFARYWTGTRHDDYAEVEDRLTLQQVWAALTPRYQETLIAYALAGENVAAAASMMSVTYTTYSSRLQWARDAARRLWHSPEAAPRHYRKTYTSKESSSRSIRPV